MDWMALQVLCGQGFGGRVDMVDKMRSIVVDAGSDSNERKRDRSGSTRQIWQWAVGCRRSSAAVGPPVRLEGFADRWLTVELCLSETGSDKVAV